MSWFDLRSDGNVGGGGWSFFLQRMVALVLRREREGEWVCCSSLPSPPSSILLLQK
jgi:hypothetical protein